MLQAGLTRVLRGLAQHFPHDNVISIVWRSISSWRRQSDVVVGFVGSDVDDNRFRVRAIRGVDGRHAFRTTRGHQRSNYHQSRGRSRPGLPLIRGRDVHQNRPLRVRFLHLENCLLEQSGLVVLVFLKA